jgi:hypothetical protein
MAMYTAYDTDNDNAILATGTDRHQVTMDALMFMMTSEEAEEVIAADAVSEQGIVVLEEEEEVK